MKIWNFYKLLQYGFKLLLVISVALSTSIWQSHIHFNHLDLDNASVFIKNCGVANLAYRQISVEYSLSEYCESAVDICNKTDLSEPEEENDIFHTLTPVQNSTEDAIFQSHSHGIRPAIHPNQVLKIYLQQKSFLC